MPAALVRVNAEALNAIEPEMVGRQCQLWDYTAIPIPPLQLKTEFIAYSSPDSTYAVTKKKFDDAKKSILIGIYDFTATYISELLLQAMRRGVKVSLMLDLDNRNGETELYQNLVDHGCEGVPSPSCATQNDAAYFASSHEKVIVIDDEWVLVQSGNYSDNSIPLNEMDPPKPDDLIPGNRDMGVAVKSKELADFFTKILRSDMNLELSGAPAAQALSESMLGQAVAVFEAAPSLPPDDLFASKPFTPEAAVTVQPILSPDNYMLEIPKWLRSAKTSICIEQQYIRGDQDKIGECMKAIVDARDNNPNLQIKIILAKPFPGKRFDKEAQKIKDLNKLYGVKVGPQVRILSPKHFVHCHNKLIIVDDKAVLISSQNWSDAALVKNREAGLLLQYPEMARHYRSIFDSDWKSGEKTLTKKKAKAEFFGPESLGTGKTVPINPGDYVIFGDDQDFPPDKRRPAAAIGKARPKRKKTTRAKSKKTTRAKSGTKGAGRKRKAGAKTRGSRSAAPR
jgi:phosphatidylserine/phosphatidylglycerophosphate/cardiolipin synthase-like enzyme